MSSNAGLQNVCFVAVGCGFSFESVRRACKREAHANLAWVLVLQAYSKIRFAPDFRLESVIFRSDAFSMRSHTYAHGVSASDVQYPLLALPEHVQR